MTEWEVVGRIGGKSVRNQAMEGPDRIQSEYNWQVMRGFLIALACCRCAFALNPSLAISQYAHKAWTVRDGFFKGAVGSIAQTPDGYLWLATEFGLIRFDGIQEVPWRPPKGEDLPDNWVTYLIASRNGCLWIGTHNGLASWKEGRSTRYPELDGLAVQSVLEDREGTIWAGATTINAGRLCAIRSGGVACAGQDGSLGNGVLSLYEDATGALWAGAGTGVWRWRPDPPKLYPAPEGLPEILSLIRGDNGALWIAVHGGIHAWLADRALDGSNGWRDAAVRRD